MGNVNPLNALHCGAFAKYVCNACRCKSQCCDEAVICSIETDEVSVASSTSSESRPGLHNLWGNI